MHHNFITTPCKAVLFAPDSPPKIIQYNQTTRKEIFPHCIEALKITALEHENLILTLLVPDDQRNLPHNTTATLVAAYMHNPWFFKDITVCGPAVLIDERGDMTTEKYKMAQNIIQCKKNRMIPEKLKQLCLSHMETIRKAIKESPNDPNIKNIKHAGYSMDDFIFGINDYGEFDE